MELIKKLENHIHEEIHDSMKYIECALKYKEEDRDLAELFYWLSQEEMGHADKLHKKVVEEIEAYRKKEGEPSVEMLALYNYLHDIEIEDATKVKLLWGMFKE